MAEGVLGVRAGLWLAVALALLLGALSGFVALPVAQHLRTLQDGVPAQATLTTNAPCMAGGCLVSFEVDGRIVSAPLPVGSGGMNSSAGTPMEIRYRADDPQVVAREEDLAGGGAAVMGVMSAAGAVLFAGMAVWMAVLMRRQRRTPSAADGPQQAGV
ncbi:hypothetical protein ABT034_27860 [Streptomyces sp. NPDC002773]|uniref:hypothetical protein n=1 Tax=Streptomyces sp. NPDC002773 TaxID=3154430 RepID=UPI003320B11E